MPLDGEMPPRHELGAGLAFDRAISPALLAALMPGGPLRGLVSRRQAAPWLLDLQLRRGAWGKRCWVSLYCGLTTVLDIEESDGRYRLRAHPAHRAAGGFEPAWLVRQPLTALAAAWPQVDGYLDRVIPRVPERHTAREGAVHACMCASAAPTYRIVNREAAVAFSTTTVKAQVTVPLQEGIAAALATPLSTSPWWAAAVAARRPLGTGADLLAVDTAGRLLVIEAKPADSPSGISWGPAQVGFYARLFSRWVDHDEQAAVAVIGRMLRQRVQLGLTGPGLRGLRAPVQVVPVLAIGAGRYRTSAMARLWSLAAALRSWLQEDPRVDPLEVWLLDSAGAPEVLYQR
jgi:hypothetical protein